VHVARLHSHSHQTIPKRSRPRRFALRGRVTIWAAMPKEGGKGKKGAKKDAMSTAPDDLFPWGVGVNDIIQVCSGIAAEKLPPSCLRHS